MKEIFNKSCEAMHELENNVVDLIVTSPPYWNLIDYKKHAKGELKKYRGLTGQSYIEYLNWLYACFKECFRTLKPGGFCSVVIAGVFYKGKYYAIPQHFIGLMEIIGYEFREEIIWRKTMGGTRRIGTFFKNPYPGYYYPDIAMAYILIFRKPGKNIYENKTTQQKIDNQIHIDKIFKKEISNNIWHITPIRNNRKDHPCPFPEEIPRRLINLFSYKGDLVLDPFLGSGTTIKIAEKLKREWVGYELEEKYIKVAYKKLKEPLKNISLYYGPFLIHKDKEEV